MNIVYSVAEFLAERRKWGTRFVGIVGPASMSYLKIGLLADLFDDALMKRLRGAQIIFVSHGTAVGVPGRLIEVAAKAGFQTLGIYPRFAGEQGLVLDKVLTYGHPVPPAHRLGRWGDEVGTLISALDSLIVFGGRHGTLTIVSAVAQENQNKGYSGTTQIPIFSVMNEATEGSLVREVLVHNEYDSVSRFFVGRADQLSTYLQKFIAGEDLVR